jgi:pimeloyl-ACP methyl ester carboxylesterase
LKQLLDHLGISDKVSVAGVSNGGSTAIDFALEYPERLKRLILIAPTVNGYEFADAHEENLWKSIDKDSQEQESAVKENRLADAVDTQIKIVASALKGTIREKAFQVAMDNSQNFVKPVYEMQIKKDPPSFKRLSEIKTPTLLIWGDMDFPGQISLAGRINSLISGSKRI